MLEIARYYQPLEWLVFENNVFLQIKINKYMKLFVIYLSLEISAAICEFQPSTLVV